MKGLIFNCMFARDFLIYYSCLWTLAMSLFETLKAQTITALLVALAKVRP